MNLESCDRLQRKPVNSTWFRAVKPQYLDKALNTRYTKKVRSRFSPDGASETPYQVLYLAENPIVAYYEVNAIFGPPSRAVTDPKNIDYLILHVSVSLHQIVDLSELDQRDILDVSAQELTGRWDMYTNGEAPTQKIGRSALQDSGYRRISGNLRETARVSEPGCLPRKTSSRQSVTLRGHGKQKGLRKETP